MVELQMRIGNLLMNKNIKKPLPLKLMMSFQLSIEMKL